MKRERKVLPYTNRFGDVINPGDKVYSITTCSHRTHISEGEYVGYVERDSPDYKTRSYKPMPYVQVRVPAQITYWFDKLKNRKYSWVNHNSQYFQENVESRTTYTTRITTLQLNNIIPRNAPVERLAEAV